MGSVYFEQSFDEEMERQGIFEQDLREEMERQGILPALTESAVERESKDFERAYLPLRPYILN